MAALSKLHDKCKKCKYKDECGEKRMVACGIAELPQTNTENIAMPSVEPYGASIARKETTITIYRGENCTIDTSLEEIKRQIEEDFYKNIRCGFNRTL